MTEAFWFLVGAGILFFLFFAGVALLAYAVSKLV